MQKRKGDFSLPSEAKHNVIIAVGGGGEKEHSEVENILNDPMKS